MCSQFGVTASNEELAAVGSSFIQLKMLLQRDDRRAQRCAASGGCVCLHPSAVPQAMTPSVVASCTHSSTETLQFELSLPQFYSLMRALEQAQLQAGGA
jgi:hypothetical protein